MKILKNIILFIVLTMMVLLQTCKPGERISQSSNVIFVDNKVEPVKLSKDINVFVNSNSTNYFIYKGLPMGYQYDMLNLMAKDLDLNLNITLDNDLDNGIKMLKKGRIDLLAVNLTVTESRKKVLDFTDALLSTKQVLVQNKSSEIIHDISMLKGKSIYVLKSSSYYETLKSISDEIDGKIDIHVESELNEEELMAKVSSGEIDYTVVDYNSARINAFYYTNIDLSLNLSGEQDIAWALNKNNSQLTNKINSWLSAFKNSAKFKQLERKYFSSSLSRRIKNDLFTQKTGKISKFDNLFKSKAKLINWDWKLLAAVSYQESNFKSKARSHMGAFGLMQLMPTTAKIYNVDINSSPSENVDAGVKYLKYLEKELMHKLSDTTDILQFTLASYNAGIGHVYDARELAKKNGKNPDIWKDNVDFYLLNKSNPEYYTDPVVKYGYCRGSEPYNYVKSILKYYENYQNLMIN